MHVPPSFTTAVAVISFFLTDRECVSVAKFLLYGPLHGPIPLHVQRLAHYRIPCSCPHLVSYFVSAHLASLLTRTVLGNQWFAKLTICREYSRCLHYYRNAYHDCTHSWCRAIECLANHCLLNNLCQLTSQSPTHLFLSFVVFLFYCLFLRFSVLLFFHDCLQRVQLVGHCIFGVCGTQLEPFSCAFALVGWT